MKLHLPNGLRKLILTGSIIVTATTIPALAWEWDPIWFEQGSKQGPDPSEVKKFVPHYSYNYLSDEKYAEYTSNNITAAFFEDVRGSICNGVKEDWNKEFAIDVETDVWHYVKSGEYDIFVGGDSNWGTDDHKDGTVGNFTGDVHIFVDRDTYFSKIVGGNYGVCHFAPANFIGNTYLSVH